MTRVKRGTMTHKRHKKILKLAKGYRGKRKNTFKLAKQAVIRAGQNAYRDRRLKKRTFRRLWITRLNIALKERGHMYSRFIRKQEDAKVLINRKMLSEMAITDPKAFDEVVKTVMGG